MESRLAALLEPGGPSVPYIVGGYLSPLSECCDDNCVGRGGHRVLPMALRLYFARGGGTHMAKMAVGLLTVCLPVDQVHYLGQSLVGRIW